MKCVFCKKNKFKVVSKKIRDSLKHKIMACKKCGLLQLFPMPSAEEDRKFYNSDRQAKNIKEPSNLRIMLQNFSADTLRRADMLQKIIKKNQNILDVGSGYGFFLEEMRHRGYEISGIEVSEERREVSSKITKAKVFDINLIDQNKILPKFDCVTLFHVLEHVKEPVKFLKIIKEHINKNGKLIIEVPNADDILLKNCKGYDDFYWQRAHLLYLNKKILEKIIKKAGYSAEKIFYIQRYGIKNLMNWLVTGKPQIETPVFHTTGDYLWLEDCYKKHLSKTGKSDTLIFIVHPKQK